MPTLVAAGQRPRSCESFLLEVSHVIMSPHLAFGNGMLLLTDSPGFTQ